MEIKLTSPGVDLDGLLTAAGKALNKAQKEIGKEIAKAARKVILDDVRAARGSLRFGKRPGTNTRYRLGTKSKIVAHGQSVDVTISANPAGFWSIVEYGSGEHEILPRTKRALFWGATTREGDPLYSATVWHPGTVGHHYWAGAESALDRALVPVIEDTFDEALTEVAA